MKNLKIFAETVEQEAIDQVELLLQQDAFKDCKVRIMPDTHAGAGCVIGFTANLGEKVIPNIVGVDIGCGMFTVSLGKIDIDFNNLDSVIRSFVPNGKNVHGECVVNFDEIYELKCFRHIKSVDRLLCSIGTLGGGNHFIEIDEDDDGYKYLVIHTGSRNLGKQVADYYQNLAYDTLFGKNKMEEDIKSVIKEYKDMGWELGIENAIKKIKLEYQNSIGNIPKDLCYLENENRKDYLHDMEICQRFAVQNRFWIASIVTEKMGWEQENSFETIHNYIDLGTNIVRKGAINADYGKRLLIPINMRDGCIVGVGKGNDDWNNSAPHGAGRIMSRRKAKETYSIEQFKDSMCGIFTTSVCKDTIDEAPMVYKNIEEIIGCIEPTVSIQKIIKPIYNFKASE